MNELQAVNGGVPAPMGVQTAAVAARESQAVQAAVFMSKTYPRDQGAALKRIEGACARVKLAENAMYSYSRGGQEITGPSIRLAEVLAQNWGNLDFGWNELDRRNGESDVEAYCWDLETNVRRPLRFKVLHVRDTKKGSYALVDQRDIYETVANQASRRVRNCILAVIPGDVVDAAIEACEKTLAGAGSLAEKRAKIIAAFKEVDVTPDEIERRIGKKMTALSDVDYVQLRKIWKSLHDGMSKKDDWFEPILDPEKIKKSQSDAEVPPHAGNQAAVDAERKVALQEFNTALAFLEEKGWPLEEIEKKLRKPIAEVRKGDVKALQYATDLIKD